MAQVNNPLITCLRAALFGEENNCNIAECVPLAHRHGVTHLLYYAFPYTPEELRPDEELSANLKRKAYAAVIREAAQQRALEELYRRFEASQIRCTALKGIALKTFYPKPELRHMSDIDLLIDPENADKVRQHFEDMGGRALSFGQSETDLYVTKEGLIFEVKRSLCSEGFNEESAEFLEKLLSFAVPINQCEYVSALPNEEHYAYVLCHMVKHLLNGGVGIRPVMDLWFCKGQMELDEEKKNALLAELKLEDFAKRAEHLACVWFGDEEMTPFDAELGDYILSSGAFGSETHKVADRMIQNRKQKKKLGYMLARFFLPYSTMQNYFPVLRKWPVLLPIFWIWRLIYALLFRRGKLAEELNAVGEVKSEILSQRLDFYRRCGIDISKK